MLLRAEKTLHGGHFGTTECTFVCITRLQPVNKVVQGAED